MGYLFSLKDIQKGLTFTVKIIMGSSPPQTSNTVCHLCLDCVQASLPTKVMTSTTVHKQTAIHSVRLAYLHEYQSPDFREIKFN